MSLPLTVSQTLTVKSTSEQLTTILELFWEKPHDVSRNSCSFFHLNQNKLLLTLFEIKKYSKITISFPVSVSQSFTDLSQLV